MQISYQINSTAAFITVGLSSMKRYIVAIDVQVAEKQN